MNTPDFVVYHTADIHIKDQRRIEYREVFNEFVARIRTINATLPKTTAKYVVLAGDIFDAKTRLSSNNITDFYYLVNSLLKEGVYIISAFGNHDVNLNQPESVDLITPLVAPLTEQDARIIHCNDTGSYIIKDAPSVCFNFISPADTCEQYPFYAPCKYNILIVHENVDGVSFGGFRLSGKVRQTHFPNYTMVLCGHIHSFIPIGKNGAYSGPLIQQTVGETYTTGFVMWAAHHGALTMRKFVPIYNRYGFIKVVGRPNTRGDIEFTDNAHPLIDGAPTPPKHPHKIVIELYDINEDSESVVKMAQTYETRYKVKPIINTLNNTVQDQAAAGAIKRLESELNQKELISAELARNAVPVDIQKEIMELHHAGFSAVEARQKKSWSIVSLEWSNLFCYGDNNYISFVPDAESGTNTITPPCVYGIIADNKCGKSSAIDALIYGLFGELLRGDVKNIVNKRAKPTDEARLRIVFRCGTDIHAISRTFGSGAHIRYTINGANCTEDRVDAVYKKVCEHIGTFGEFVTVSAMTQGRNDDFLYMSNQQRLDFLKSILGLDVFESQLEDAKVNRRDLLSKRSMLTARDEQVLDTECARLEAVIANTREKMAACETIIKDNSNFTPVRPAVSPSTINSQIVELERALESAGGLPSISATDAATTIEAINLRIAKPSAYQYKCAARPIKITDDSDDVKDVKNVEPLRIIKAHLDTELAAYNEKMYANTLDTNEVISPEIDAQIHEVSDECARLSIQYNPCLNSYAPYLIHKREDIARDLALHKEIDARIAASGISFDIMPLNDSSNLVKMREDLEVIKSNAIQYKTKHESAETRIAELRTLYKSSYETYNYLVEDVSKRDLENEAAIHDRLSAARIELAAFDSTRRAADIHRELGGRTAAEITARISELRAAQLAANSAYKKVVARLEFATCCDACAKNKKVITITGEVPAKGAIDALVKERDTVRKLESALDIANKADNTRSKIADIKHAMRFPSAAASTIQYALKHYDEILSNIRMYNTIQALQTEAREFAAKLADARETMSRLTKDIECLEISAMLARDTIVSYRPHESQRSLLHIYTEYNNIVKNSSILESLNVYKARLTELQRLKNIQICRKFKKRARLVDAIEAAETHEAINAINTYNADAEERARLTGIINAHNIATSLKQRRAEYEQAVVQTTEYERNLERHSIYRNSMTQMSALQCALHEYETQYKAVVDERRICDKQREIDRKIVVYTEYIKTLDNKTGLPVKILQSSCRQITNAANSMLAELCDFKVDLNIEFKLKTCGIRLNIHHSDGSKLPVDLGSGYQKMVIAVSLRNAFAKVSKNPMSDILIVDEGFSCLDSKNLAKIIDMIPLFKQRYNKVLMISHIDAVKAAIERPIYITNVGGNSCIRVGHVENAAFESVQLKRASAATSSSTHTCVACKFETTSAARYAIHLKSKGHARLTQQQRI